MDSASFESGRRREDSRWLRPRLSSPRTCNFKNCLNLATEPIQCEILKEFRISEALGYFIGDKISMPSSGSFFSNKFRRLVRQGGSQRLPSRRLCVLNSNSIWEGNQVRNKVSGALGEAEWKARKGGAGRTARLCGSGGLGRRRLLRCFSAFRW